jgi:hypothetical protein
VVRRHATGNNAQNQQPGQTQKPEIGQAKNQEESAMTESGRVQTRAKTADEKYCHECGEIIRAKAEICPKCGVRQPVGAGLAAAKTGLQLPSGRNRSVAIVLALFLGGLGMHKFYLGKNLQGFFYLAFCWTLIPALLGLVDVIRLLLQSDQAFAEAYP